MTNVCLLALVLGLSGANAQDAAPQIPAQFRGTWAASTADCHGGNLVIVQDHAIAGEGGESGWVLKKILQNDPTTLIALYDFGGEGFDEPDVRISLRLLSKDTLHADFTSPATFARCDDRP